MCFPSHPPAMEQIGAKLCSPQRAWRNACSFPLAFAGFTLDLSHCERTVACSRPFGYGFTNLACISTYARGAGSLPYGLNDSWTISDSNQSMPRECPKCSLPIRSFGQHLRQHPQCRSTEAARVGVQFVAAPQFHDEYDINGAEQRRRLADVLSECRYERCWSNADVGQLKTAYPDMYDATNLGAYDALKPLLQSGVTADHVTRALAELGHTAFKGIETRARELAYAKGEVPYIEPRVVLLEKGGSLDDQVVSFPMTDLLIRDLQHDPVVRHHTLKKSDYFKTGRDWCAPPRCCEQRARRARRARPSLACCTLKHASS